MYANNDPKAIIAMEKARMGDDYYGGDIYDEDVNECPVCGALYPGYFYMNDDEVCVGCEMCVTKVMEI